jgi:hypothetical protein
VRDRACTKTLASCLTSISSVAAFARPLLSDVGNGVDTAVDGTQPNVARTTLVVSFVIRTDTGPACQKRKGQKKKKLSSYTRHPATAARAEADVSSFPLVESPAHSLCGPTARTSGPEPAPLPWHRVVKLFLSVTDVSFLMFHLFSSSPLPFLLLVQNLQPSDQKTLALSLSRIASPYLVSNTDAHHGSLCHSRCRFDCCCRPA